MRQNLGISENLALYSRARFDKRLAGITPW